MATDEITPFLKTIAHKFVNDEDLRANLFKYRFFFQNKRAGKFFHHYIKEELIPSDHPTILPEITTLPDYLRKCQHIPEEDINNELFLVYHLFNTYQISRKSKIAQQSNEFQDINSFYNFGKLILTDFNDIDLQLKDPKKIFRNLQDLKELTVVSSEYLSENQIAALGYFISRDVNALPLEDHFNTFFEDLAQIYDEYKKCLRSNGLAYKGMVLRDTINAIEGGLLNLTTDEKINVFVGLNALTQSEIKILQHFKDSGKSYFYWDYDSPFFEQDLIFGKFKRENLQRFPEPKEGDQLYLEHKLPNRYPDIKVISVPSKVGQAAFIGEELNQIAQAEVGLENMKNMKVAIVLANERLLTSVLSYLDSSLFLRKDKTNSSINQDYLVNVTMGYPIKENPTVGMLLRLLQLQKVVYRRKTWKGSEICEILSSNLLSNKPQELYNQIINNHLYWLDDIEINELISEHCSPEETKELRTLLFVPSSNDEGLLLYLSSITKLLLDRELSKSINDEESSSVSSELIILKTLEHLIERQKKSFENYQKNNPSIAVFTFDTLYDILTNMLLRARIPFSGEPLRGLQIMGILETRSLDFETIYIIDGTDGILPAHTKSLGIIPHNLRYGHDLPTYQWQEQTRAYNFYRLISRAKEVIVLYDSRSNNNSKGEPSRYIQQLNYLFPSTPHISFSTANFKVLTQEAEADDFQIDCNKVSQFRKQITEQSEIGKRYLSPSRIIDYIECPRKFYFQSVIGIEEEEETDDVLDERMLGTLVHDTINSLYKKYIGKPLNIDELNSLKNNNAEIIKHLQGAIKNIFKSQDLAQKGINKVNVETTALGLIKNIISLDTDLLRQASVKYLGGEIPIYYSYSLSNSNISVNLKGFIDRIDYLESETTYRIIDFKTGRDVYNLSLDITESKKLNRAALQLFSYCMMINEGGLSSQNNCIIPNNSADSLFPLMIKPRSLECTPFKITKDKILVQKYSDVALEFKVLIDGILRNIVEEDNDFKANPNPKGACRYCPANSICPDAIIEND